jgi:hypothetical protein
MVRFRVVLAALAVAAASLLVPGQAAAAGPTVAGGDQLTNPSSGRCLLGYNVTGRGILTAGCGPVGTQWYAGSTLVGHVSWTRADGTGGLIQIDNAAVTQLAAIRTPGALTPVTGAGTAAVGTQIRAYGPVTGVRTGTVTAVNTTVNFPTGTVTGLLRTTVCSEAGERGKPMFRSTTAIALSVGGSGSCTSGGTTYGRPVTELLAATGRAILT